MKGCENTGLRWWRQLCRLDRDDRIVVLVSDEFRHLIVLVHDIELYALLVVVMVFVVIRLACCTEHDTLRGYKTFVVFAVNSITDFEGRISTRLSRPYFSTWFSEACLSSPSCSQLRYAQLCRSYGTLSSYEYRQLTRLSPMPWSEDWTPKTPKVAEKTMFSLSRSFLSCPHSSWNL